jgi:hypothetical protein
MTQSINLVEDQPLDTIYLASGALSTLTPTLI